MLKIEWDGQHFTLSCTDPGSGHRGWKKKGLSPRKLLDEIRRVHKNLDFDEENDFDLRVWRKPETKNMSATYTLSVGGRGIAYDMPREQVLQHLAEEWEEVEREQFNDKDVA